MTKSFTGPPGGKNYLMERCFLSAQPRVVQETWSEFVQVKIAVGLC